MKLKFYGAAETVTGSKTLVEVNGKKFLVDAGMFQGPKARRLLNWDIKCPVRELDGVILTHAHIDHSGILPKLYADGFRGPVYCSKGTKQLCEVLLPDAAYLQEEDAEYANRTGHSKHKPALPLYTTKDAEMVLRQFEVVERDQWVDLTPDLSLRLLRSGHIIGSSFVQLSYEVNEKRKIITFSGDMGSGRSEIIKPPVYIKETDFLVMESTYGDRLHPRISPEIELGMYLKRILERGGVAVIPSFAVGRTQEVLFHIDKLMEKEKIPKVPVYVDSPMASSANHIYLKNSDEHQLKIENEKIVSPICPQDYRETRKVEESMKLINKPGPFIVISASGMLSGGRILHHLKARLPHKENGVIFVGYQAPETKGNLLRNGISSIRLHHEEIPVNAQVFGIDGLSAHADFLDILEWLKHLTKAPDCIFVNHGEKPAALNLKRLIESELGFKATIPEYLEEINLANWEY